MRFPPLLVGRLIARRQRFLADVRLPSGEQVTAYCPNTGSMRSCLAPGWRVALSRAANPTRRLPYTLELAHISFTICLRGAGWSRKVPANRVARGSARPEIITRQGVRQ